MAKISIIVPVYNNEKYINDCLDSLVNQTYYNIEIIIINDGSSDRSLDICNKYKEKDSRIRIKSIPNSGVSTARNIGLEMCTGDYIIFVDSDDWIELNTVELVYNKLVEEQSDIVIWSYYKNYPNNEMKKSLIPGGNQIIKDETDKKILYLKSVYSKYGSTGDYSDVSAGTVMCKMYKRKLIIENNLQFNPDLIRSEDVVFALHAFYHAEKIVYIDNNLYHYRMNEDSMCAANKFIADTRGPFDLLIDELLEFQKKIPNIDEYDEVLYGRTIQAILWHLKYNYYHKDNQLSRSERKKLVLELINHKNYKVALKKINLETVPKQERLMVKLFNKKLIYSHMFLQGLIEYRNKRNTLK